MYHIYNQLSFCNEHECDKFTHKSQNLFEIKTNLSSK